MSQQNPALCFSIVCNDKLVWSPSSLLLDLQFRFTFISDKSQKPTYFPFRGQYAIINSITQHYFGLVL
jgi:hypothetical protein